MLMVTYLANYTLRAEGDVYKYVFLYFGSSFKYEMNNDSMSEVNRNTILYHTVHSSCQQPMVLHGLDIRSFIFLFHFNFHIRPELTASNARFPALYLLLTNLCFNTYLMMCELHGLYIHN